MKFMTPDLLARFRSEEDAVADAAAEEWERACKQYNARLKEVMPDLPTGVRRLLRRYNLHDARLLTMAADEAAYFSIFLELNRPADPRDQYFELRYRLVGGVEKGLNFQPHAALAGDAKPFGWWLYDEIEPVSELPIFRHSILFTGGYELQVTFFNLGCRRLPFVLSGVDNLWQGTQGPKSLPA